MMIVGCSRADFVIGVRFRAVVYTLKQGANTGNLVGAMAVGEEAEVPNTMETSGKDMLQKAPDELDRLEGHDFEPIAPAAAIILVSKADLARFTGNEAAVGDGNAMSVA